MTTTAGWILAGYKISKHWHTKKFIMLGCTEPSNFVCQIQPVGPSLVTWFKEKHGKNRYKFPTMPAIN